MKIGSPAPGVSQEPRASLSAPEPSASPLRPSTAVTSLIERLRTRFNVGVELLDAGLLPVAPVSGADFYAALMEDLELRRQATALVASVRTENIAAGASTFLVQPLRAPGRSRRPIGVLVFATGGAKGSHATAEVWADVLRSTIEADVAQLEAQGEQRLESRRATAALRFLARTSSFETEGEVIRGIIHAAAVWFDVDARVYRKNFAGDFVLHTHLPGVSVAPEARLLPGSIVGPDRVRRVPFFELPDALRWSTSDVLLFSVDTGDADEWVLALGGQLPPSADALMAALTQALGAQLRVRLEERLEQLRRMFGALIAEGGAAEATAARLLRQLRDETGATAGTLAIYHGSAVQRLAAFGSAQPATTPLPLDPLLAPDQLTYPMALRADRAAVLDLRTDATFSVDAGRALLAVGRIVHAWLAGAELGAPSAPAERPAAFARRIAEELERAKRFDLGLSMVLIDLNQPSLSDDQTVLRMVDAVRHELRGSDLLGVLDDGRIAALLVHTDAAGVTSVVPRLRRRVADMGRTLGVANPRFGRAVFSQECRTASALVSEALRDLEIVR